MPSPISIRTIGEQDAEDFLRLRTRLEEETSFMLLEAGERTTTVDEQLGHIRRWLSRDNQTVLVAEAEGSLVGFMGAFGGDFRRDRHCARIVVGVLQSHAGRGLGTRLFQEMDTWARATGLRRLELTVMACNPQAVALYRKMGFEIEGTRRQALCVAGAFIDELHMGRLLD